MLRDEIHIDAPLARVWELTRDVEAWPRTTPTMTSVERLDTGPLGVGSQARVAQPGLRPRVWTVSRYEPERAFEWGSHLGWLRMVGGHHLHPDGDGCRNELTLELSGFASGIVERLLARRLLGAIRTENAGFARAATVTAG